MKNKEIDRIEQELGIKLPQSYRSAVTVMPVRFADGMCTEEVWYSGKRIIHENKRLREERAWPANLFFFGQGGPGLQNAIYLATESVHYIKFEDIASFREADALPDSDSYVSFSEWYSAFLDTYRDFNGVDFDSETGIRRIDDYGAGACASILLITVILILALAVIGVMALFGYW